MVYKRSFGDEESYDLSRKHQRQLSYSNQHTSFFELGSSCDVTCTAFSVGQGGAFSKSQGEVRGGSAIEFANPASYNFESGICGGSAHEELSRSEAEVKLLFSPGLVETGCPTRTLVQHDAISTSFLDYPPRKLVPIGLDHQANIPKCAASNIVDDDNWEKKRMGTCLLPMPNSEELLYNIKDVGKGRDDNCKCIEQGGARCFGYHILEARNKLRNMLGNEKFFKMGFYEMGEIVARHWTKEEEQIFEDIIFSNNASLDKNLWKQLSVAFPSRRKMDLVSYYFNVFTLRRRAEQNQANVHIPLNLAAEGGDCSKSQVVGDVAGHTMGADKEFETRVLGGSSCLSRVNSSTGKEDPRFDIDNFETGCSTRISVQFHDPYSSVFDSPPRKLVPVGSDHQAIIPICAASMADNDNSERLMGTCVLPMPDPEALIYNIRSVGNGTTGYCNCPDRSSLRCVRYHISESRDKLKHFFGKETFTKLGFEEMGEIVARKWTEVEQQVFRDVVFLNPVSFGKSFWAQLAEVFPSRSKMELVSYYFNVFMLQRRAEQNRSNHMNIDSDNDEWQRSDDEDESGVSDEEEEEASVIESPADQNNADGNETYNNVNSDAIDDWFIARKEEDNGGIDNVLVTDFNPRVKHEDKNPKRRRENQDFQDDSCTSDECHPGGTYHNKKLKDDFNGLQDYELETCDTKVWNMCYVSGRKSYSDLLPTSTMIEEIFGEEAWNDEGKDEKRRH